MENQINISITNYSGLCPNAKPSNYILMFSKMYTFSQRYISFGIKIRRHWPIKQACDFMNHVLCCNLYMH